MNKFLRLLVITLAVTSFAATVSACRPLGCKKGIKLSQSLEAIEVRITNAITNPDELLNTCTFMDEEGLTTMSKAARFADRAAYSQFYYESTKCIQGFWTVRCYYRNPGYGYPQPYPPRPYPPYNGGRYCYDEYVCTQYQTTPHKLDGFEDAIFVSEELTKNVAEVKIACSDARGGNTALAMLRLFAVRTMLAGPVKEKAILAFSKAGCYSEEE